jgi:hypothetical protein
MRPLARAVCFLRVGCCPALSRSEPRKERNGLDLGVQFTYVHCTYNCTFLASFYVCSILEDGDLLAKFPVQRESHRNSNQPSPRVQSTTQHFPHIFTALRGNSRNIQLTSSTLREAIHGLSFSGTMHFFLVALLLAALPFQSVANPIFANPNTEADFHFFDPKHQLCYEEQLSEMASRVHYAKNEMIITRLITRDQFSKFVLSNGVYNECRKLQEAFDFVELFSAYDPFYLQRTLKNLIESYSSTPLADKDVSRFAQAISFVILPGDMQAAVRTSGSVNGAVLGMSTYLQRNPSAYQSIMSSLLQSTSALGISRTWQLGSYSILSGALGLCPVESVGTYIAALEEKISANYDNFAKPGECKLTQARFVPLGAVVPELRTQFHLYDEGLISEDLAISNVQTVLEGAARSARGMESSERGAMISAISYQNVGVVSKGVHAYMQWFFDLPMDIAVEESYKVLHVPDWKSTTSWEEWDILHEASKFLPAEKGQESLLFSMHLEVIRLHREGLLKRDDPCDVAPAQRIPSPNVAPYLPYSADTDTREYNEVTIACLLEKYTCVDQQHNAPACFYRTDRVKLLYRDLLFDSFAFFNSLRTTCPDLPKAEINRKKKFYLDHFDELDALKSKDVEWHYEAGVKLLQLETIHPCNTNDVDEMTVVDMVDDYDGDNDVDDDDGEIVYGFYRSLRGRA